MIVKNSTKTLKDKIISKYSDTKDTDIGFKAVEEIVTTSDDNELFDNQGAVPDVSAPGADRYRIRLTIAEQTETDSDENFIPVAEVRNGLIYNAVGHLDAYNIPAQQIAERIKENSGDYIVKPFTINFAPDSASTTHLQLRVSDGIVVVDGYRAARNSPTIIKLPKSTTTVKLENEVAPANFSNFVFVNPFQIGYQCIFRGNGRKVAIIQFEVRFVRYRYNHGVVAVLCLTNQFQPIFFQHFLCFCKRIFYVYMYIKGQHLLYRIDDLAVSDIAQIFLERNTFYQHFGIVAIAQHMGNNFPRHVFRHIIVDETACGNHFGIITQ